MARSRWSARQGTTYAVAVLAVFAVVALAAVAVPRFFIPPRDSEAASLIAAGRTLELSEAGRLEDRRVLVAGDRLHEVFAADNRYPAIGGAIRGEMGGFWSGPLKLLDGIWFSAEGKWLGPATRSTSSAGFVRSELPTRDNIRASRVDIAPDGLRAALVGLTLTSPKARTVTVTVSAHSELLSATPGAPNGPDTATFTSPALVFRDTAAGHDWAAVVAANRAPESGRVGTGFRGPQEPPVRCTPGNRAAQQVCDDSDEGRGAGGELRYSVALPPGLSQTLWFTVAGSDRGPGGASAEKDKVFHDPEQLFARKLADRRAIAARTVVDLPGDRRLERSVDWSKQNLADAVQSARNARWYASGLPDRPGIRASDLSYTLYAAMAAGQFETAKAAVRALAAATEANGAVPGAIGPAGAADTRSSLIGDSPRLASAVALVWRWTGDDKFRDELYDAAVRAVRHAVNDADSDGDGWPEGPGLVTRPDIGRETIDNAAHTIRGLRDLADLAASRGDQSVASFADDAAERREEDFDDTWWIAGSAKQYADSLSITGSDAGTKVLGRDWTGAIPMAAMLIRPGRLNRPLASIEHARDALTGREGPCYTSEGGLLSTGTGPTSAEGGNRGAACDSERTAHQSDLTARALGTAVLAVGEGNFGRTGVAQSQRYTTALARLQLDRAWWEMPGMMGESAPGGDNGSDIDRPFLERAQLLSPAGTYGVLWPVVTDELGIQPDIGRGRVSVVPQIPEGQRIISGAAIQLGGGSIDVKASRDATSLTTTVNRRVQTALTIGAVLPAAAGPGTVRLGGRPVPYRAQYTSRGVEIVVDVPAGTGSVTVEVSYR